MVVALAVLAAAQKASRNKQVFLVDFQTRTDPFIIEAVKRTHAGLIGDLAMISSFYTDGSFPDPPLTDNIEVFGSHIGLGFNAAVLYAVAERLAQAEGEWQPFERSGWRMAVYGPAQHPESAT